MAKSRKQFSRKMGFAYGVLLLISLVLSAYFILTLYWIDNRHEHISRHRNLALEYKALDLQLHKWLNVIQASVTQAAPGDVERLLENASETVDLLARIREVTTSGLESKPGEQATAELASLGRIEALVGDMLNTSEQINGLLVENRTQLAVTATQPLYAQIVDGELNQLISDAIETHHANAESSVRQSEKYTRYVSFSVLLIVFLIGLYFLLVVRRIPRGMVESVDALLLSAQEFSNENLSHRIPELQQQEFSLIGRAYNAVALVLEERIKRLQDVNKRLEARMEEHEAALQANERKLSEVDENRRKLLADISHEFRTPLTVIRGESEIALRGEDKTKDQYRETLERIMEQADQTTRLVDDLLFIARANAGEPRLEIRSVPIVSIVESVCNDFTAPAKQKDITILPSCKGRKAAVLGDPGRLRQVFTILVDNALRYSFKGGVINVNLGTSDDHVTITVRDRGIGLSEEDKLNAFRRFYRGVQAAGHARGTGLGLPVAKAIVIAHNGSITLESAPEAGAIATVVLPIEDDLRDVD